MYQFHSTANILKARLVSGIIIRSWDQKIIKRCLIFDAFANMTLRIETKRGQLLARRSQSHSTTSPRDALVNTSFQKNDPASFSSMSLC